MNLIAAADTSQWYENLKFENQIGLKQNLLLFCLGLFWLIYKYIMITFNNNYSFLYADQTDCKAKNLL